ncbi:SDR family oxidoreductase [Massilia sp. YIM B02763]|uniref:SDR family oxidoreductase n=1 Tax=Massilia sp. YIM B02763 TaxID=3050130 RepID=UPI0025B70820|nr:SDR family oxidoreductase [Massilia sp. YIM B02763]MDN4056052.1 SDR family oxidoreductase [Massilia sp. YIM B02763]
MLTTNSNEGGTRAASTASAAPTAAPATARAALVTGAGRRIGRAIAFGMAAQGWDIAVHYRQSAAEAEEVVHAIRAMGRRAAALHADLADEGAVRALPGQALHLLGRLDCIVNNASLFEYDKPDAFSPALLATHMQCNVAAPLVLAQELHRLVPDGGQAVAINLLDQKLYNLNPDFLSYTLSKAALHTATTMLAQALAPKLRVVGVAPGITLVSGDQSQAGFEQAHTATPLGRSSTPQDIVDAVLYAAQARALTGTTLLVDGGQHLVPLGRDVMFLTDQ